MSIFKANLFKGKVAIVTGGGTGIGRAITEELTSLGCRVVIASRNEERLRAAAAELDPSGNQVLALPCNIRKEDQVKSLMSETISKLGKLDYVINNGGGQFLSTAEGLSLKGWNAVVETNLTGSFLMCQQAYAAWMKDNGGVIVNITMDMFRGTPMMPHSAAARAAVDNLTKTLAVEWAESGVRVNAVAPGSCIYSPTASLNYGRFDIFEQVREHVPAKRLGSPREVSSAVCFLLSPGASFVSGATLVVDAAMGHYAPLLYRIPEHNRWPPHPSWDDTLPSGDSSS